MQKFKFVKPRLTEINGHPVNINYRWRIVIENAEQLITFTETYQHTIIEEGIKDLFSGDQRISHKSSDWAVLIDRLSQITENSYIEQSSKTERDVFIAKMEVIWRFGKIYVDENASFFPHTDDIQIMHEVEKDTLVWPHYDSEDIRIVRWPGGKHYYAKIGKLPVVDEKGNEKWNTEERARAKAEKYLNELIQEDYGE